jgi:hypothetical protein
LKITNLQQLLSLMFNFRAASNASTASFSFPYLFVNIQT